MAKKTYKKPASVVLAEDDKAQRDIMLRSFQALSGELEVVEVFDTVSGLREYLEYNTPDILVTDMRLKDGDVTSFLQEKEEFPFPVMIITAYGDERKAAEFSKKGFEYRSKNDDSKLLVRLADEARDLLRRWRHEKEREELKKEALLAQQEAIFLMAELIETRARGDRNHIRRVGKIARIIGKNMSLDEDQLDLLELAATLHDVGKIGIPDHILLKEGKLTDVQFKTMQRHTEIGFDHLNVHETPMMKMAAQIAVSHHEKWNGAGYPHRLKGDQIPLVARITALADVLDALLSERCYKAAWSVDEAYSEIIKSSGTHFDPDVVQAFEFAWLDIKALFEDKDSSDTDVIHDKPGMLALV